MNRVKALVGVAALIGALSVSSANAAVFLTQGGVADPNAGIVSAFGPVTFSFNGGTGPLTSATPVTYQSGTNAFGAAPFGDTTTYASIGGATFPQTANLALGGVNYLGFYWGSIDSYNTLVLTLASGASATYIGNDILNPANGFQGLTGSSFVNFNTLGTDKIVSAAFTSTQRAFEIDSITTAVPEPSTWALMVFGFAGLGFLGYRRRMSGPNFRVV